MEESEFVLLSENLPDKKLRMLLYLDILERWGLRIPKVVKHVDFSVYLLVLEKLRQCYSGFSEDAISYPHVELEEHLFYYRGMLAGKGQVKKTKRVEHESALLVTYLNWLSEFFRLMGGLGDHKVYKSMSNCSKSLMKLLKDGPARRVPKNDEEWLRDKFECLGVVTTYTSRLWTMYYSEEVFEFTPYTYDWKLL